MEDEPNDRPREIGFAVNGGEPAKPYCLLTAVEWCFLKFFSRLSANYFGMHNEGGRPSHNRMIFWVYVVNNSRSVRETYIASVASVLEGRGGHRHNNISPHGVK